MELESIKFIKKQKKSGEYETQRELDLKESKNKKMDVLHIKSVLIILFFIF